MQRPVGVCVDRHPQGVPELELQANKVQEARTIGEVHQDIEIARLLGLTSRTRAEYPGSAYAVPAKNGQRLLR